jgi:broad specificity phosphatase PhoE
LELHFTRHGQTHDNITGTLAGQQPGKLTDMGIKQARQTGKYLKNAKFDYVYVSDLARTKDTFKTIADETEFIKNTNPIYTPELREKDCGVLAGQPIRIWKENADK